VRDNAQAVNKLTATPNARVKENPLTIVAPNWLPNQKRIALVISVAMFESRIEGQALVQPKEMAISNRLPLRNSSLSLSKINMLASKALPVLNKKPAMPGKVIVIGINLYNAKAIRA